ncbi:MAG TPA: 1-deoxy-D-xylulose-5-phosphate synthase N-terminal domain-containing protein, partial [Corynebacterium sp.]|nr:1-deoxy-D-xylulose-5-phosphate synthase N-terminal domain-containing protein [Corynebacterium sp.]
MTLSPELQALTERRYPADWTETDTRAVDTVRILAADAVQNCGSGHPGTAMSLAPLAYTLYQRVLDHDPNDTDWVGRDRFVLSCGHTSLTQYIQLYLGGFGLEMDDLKALRTWGSLTPGHPEVGHTRGVEITTGPLGQGLANAVGMALAEKLLAARYNRPEHEIVNHWTWVLVGDGCLMEGISHEAASLAGTLKLGKLVVLYDDNGISIDGQVDGWFSDDT